MSIPAQPLGLRNAFVRVTKDRRLKIVVVGNSVTNGAPDGHERNPSFYVALGNWFRKTFPDAVVEVIPKIIFAVGPEMQLFRMDERVTAEKPDLVLVEFNAANGAWGAKGRHLTEPASEGYFRRLRSVLPEADCLIEMALYEAMMEDYSEGRIPASGAFQIEMARHYGCVYADAGSDVAARLLKGETWATYMDDGIHPSLAGYAIYSETLLREVEHQWGLFQLLPEAERVIRPHVLPETSIDSDPWVHPLLCPSEQASYDDSFHKDQSGQVPFTWSETFHGAGEFEVPFPARVVGILMRDSGKCGNLEIRLGEGWRLLSQKNEPHFTHGDDPDNRFYRNFFGVYGLPSYLQKVEFRVTAKPEVAGNARVEIAGFLVLERSRG